MSLGPISLIAVLASCVALGSAFYDYNEEYHTCCAWGDPHYNTFDGATIHYQGTCRYLLTGTCPCSKVQYPFKVFVENEQIGTSSVSRTRMVDIEIYDYRVRFKENGFVEMWNPAGAWFSPILPYSFEDATITQSGYTLTFTTDDGITVVYSGNHRACVTVPCKYEEELCGLCGNLNGVLSDDYVTSINDPVSQNQAGYNQIGDSWQVVPLATPITLSDECYEEQPGGGSTVDVTPAESNEYCRKMIADCPAAKAFYRSCLYDVGSQPNNAQAHCQAVETGLLECGRLPEHWRKDYNCPCPNGEFTEPCGPCWDGTYSDPCPRQPCTGRRCVAVAEDFVAVEDFVAAEGK